MLATLNANLLASSAQPSMLSVFSSPSSIWNPSPPPTSTSKGRERIKASFGYDPLQCPRCGRTLELAEIWEPKRGHIWMKRWLETHRMRKAARLAMKQLLTRRSRRYYQLAFNFDT